MHINAVSNLEIVLMVWMGAYTFNDAQSFVLLLATPGYGVLSAIRTLFSEKSTGTRLTATVLYWVGLSIRFNSVRIGRDLI